MHPLVLLAGSAAIGVGAYAFSEKKKKGQSGKPSPSGTVTSLVKGKTYAVIAVITKAITDDPRWKALGDIPNEKKVQQLIASTFAQSGCKVLSTPVVRDNAEMSKAMAGEPSAWVFNMQWLMDDTYIKRQIPWLGNAAFFLLPVS